MTCKHSQTIMCDECFKLKVLEMLQKIINGQNPLYNAPTTLKGPQPGIAEYYFDHSQNKFFTKTPTEDK